MYRLVISDDAGKTTVVTLVRDEITIGRAEDNHICLTERNVSRHHGRLMRRGDSYGVDDLGSYNGIKINGARIEGSAELSPGDKVSIGDYQLRFESDAKVAGADSTPDGEDVDVDMPLPPRLVLLTAPAPGAEFALARLPARFGRSEDVDITVNHRSISREHAEFTEIDGACVVKDLGSANGIRVNGEDIQEATLEDGDVLELGQVRLRFVAQGVEYTFDPNAPDVAEEDGAGSGPRTPVIVAVLVLVVAVAAAAAIAVKTSRPKTTHMAPAAAPTAADEARALASAIAECQTAIAASRWEDALRAAERAVLIDPTSSPAHDCRATANAGANAGAIAQQAIALFGQNEVVRAYRETEAIPAGNPVRQQPELVNIARAYAELKNAEARAAIAESRGHDASMAVTEALAAIHDFGLDDLQAATDALLVEAQALPQDVAPAAPSAAVEPGAAAPEAPAPNDLSAAQACFDQGDFDCVLVATEGVGTVQAMDLRFRALRRTPGRRADAVLAARALIARYPNSRPAERAHEYLDPTPAGTP